MKDTLIKELCYYLGELDYIIENYKDYQQRRYAEFERNLIHELLNIPYKPKRNNIDYKKLRKEFKEVLSKISEVEIESWLKFDEERLINENKTIKEN